MSAKPSGRLLQIGIGVLLLVASGLYLWRVTIVPILHSKRILGGGGDSERVDAQYLSWKERSEQARAKALEADRESRLRGKADNPEASQKAGLDGSK
jgi:hypothetical protein